MVDNGLGRVVGTWGVFGRELLLRLVLWRTGTANTESCFPDAVELLINPLIPGPSGEGP